MRSDRSVLPPGDYADARAAFDWSLPADFSIAHSCCDHWATLDPDRPAIIDLARSGAREVWSFGRLKDASDRFASILAARGVGRGDRVALLLPQSPFIMVTHFAVMKLGAVVLPLFTLFGEDALEIRLADSGARLAVTDDANLDKLMAVAPKTALCETVTTGTAHHDGPVTVRPLSDALKAAQPATPVAVGPDDPAVMIYTSGTTGAPKGALHGHRFLAGHLPAVEMILDRPTEGDIGWTPADWAWIGGLMDLAMPTLYYGLPLIAQRMRKFDPEAAFAMMRDERVSISFLPPTALRTMRQVAVPDGLSLRAVGSGGESLGADLLDWAAADLGAELNELYGQTECNLVLASGLGVRKAGMIGKPVPGHEVAILGPDGQPLGPGQEGEIAVMRPDPVMFLGYWNQPEKTAAKFDGDWLRTGDLGVMDDEGFFGFMSRDDDVITSAGYRIGPTEIENCLAGDADVVAAAVVGWPDEVRGEIVKAYVVLRDGAVRLDAVERLTARVKEKVSPHCAPRAIEFVDDLPKTATGKIMRRALRKPD